MENAAKKESVRQYFDAYRTKDRALLESLLHPEFQFKSPIDDTLNMASYFSRCWPISEHTQDVHILNLACEGDLVFCRYDMEMEDRENFSNVDTFLMKDGKIIGQQCYFGDPPHGLTRSELDQLTRAHQKAS